MAYELQRDGTYELCERRMVRCPTCKGTGVRYTSAVRLERIIVIDCPHCKGSTQIPDPDDLAYPQQPGESDRDFHERLAVHADSRRK